MLVELDQMESGCPGSSNKCECFAGPQVRLSLMLNILDVRAKKDFLSPQKGGDDYQNKLDKNNSKKKEADGNRTQLAIWSRCSGW